MITSENYREIYEDLVEETEDFTSESGVVKCTTKKASDIIREILSNYYNIIDYGISDIEDIEGNVYMVIYNDRNDDEELSFEEEPFDEPEEIEEVPDDIELPEDEDTVQESLSLVENYITEGIEESKSFVSEALKKHPEFRELIKAGAWGELQEQVYKYYKTDDIKSESAWGKFLEVLDKSGVKYKIDYIPEYCFRNSDITSFKIPEGTTKIGMCAFERCYNLTSIEIPDSVTTISYRAFWSCTSLTEIKLPASLEILGSEVFRNCKNWKGDVVIPNTCHSIMDGVFMKCASLDSVTIPKSVTSIGSDCFKECNLKSISLPETLAKYKYNPYAKKIGINGMSKRAIIITESLVEKIVKKGSKWQVQSEKGRNLGTYDTKEKAKKRLGQVEFFKQNESIDDNFKLHHSLKEDIPTFWEWVDDQGLDPDVVEENPDLEEYFRQQYDTTFNLKSPEDYDLSDEDVPDDYDDFDFYQHEEELPGYHYVCYFDDDDKVEDDSGDVDTLEKAIEVCDNLRASKGYDCSEIFGPKGDTVATFWEGQWNTNYGESLNETLSGLKSKKKLDILKELKKNPNYKEDPRWKEFEDELINFYHVDPSEADIDTAIYYTETDWIDAQHQMESLEEDSTGKVNFENREVIKLIKETADILNWTVYGISFYGGGPTVNFCRPEGEIKSASEKRKVRQLFEDTFNGLTDDISIKVWSCVPLDVKKYNYPYPEGAFQISLKVTKYDRELSKDSHPLTDFEVHHLLGFRKPKESDYWDNKNESLTEGDELKFSPNYNPAGTPIGRGTGLGEELDDEEPSLECLNCGCDTEWLGTQGDLEEFKCPQCGEYYYLTKDGRVVGEEAFQESLNSKKKLTEAIVNGAFTPETFDKVLRSAELSSDLNDDEFTDELCDVIYNELKIAKSPELSNWEDGYYDCAQAYEELLTNEGRQAVTEFVSNHLFIPGDRRATNNNRSKDELESGTTLTGVDTEGEQIYIGIDDKVYMFEEDPEDGYRSYMKDYKVVNWDLNNKFDPIEVRIVKFKEDGKVKPKLLPGKDTRFDGYEIYDAKNKKPILIIGTDYIDDYYPSAIFEWHPENMSINESLTEALIDRDMDTIKQSDLSKAPMGSVLKLKFNERPNNNWVDAYVKLDTDDWAVLDDAGEIDGDYNLLNSQSLYWSFMDSFDEMTEFEIDTAPNKKYNFNLTEAVIDFYNNNIKKQYSRFCDIYERAFEKIPDLKIKVINRSYVAEKTINSSDAIASVGILGGDSDGTFFELRLDPEVSDSFATYYIDKDGNVSVESTIYGNIVELCHLFDKKKDGLIDLITPLFDEAYDKLSEAIKNAGFKLGESLTEEAHETLNQAIWDENKELKPEVKSKLELIVDKFKERLKEDGVDIDIDDVLIVGSNANYNYTDKSDIDLHLIADLSIYKDKEDLAQVVYNAYRRLFNDKFDPMIYGHEVELYIEPKE